MSPLVRIRNGADLRALVVAVGSQTKVARAAGMSLQQLNQLITGVRPRIGIEQAARLEDTLSLPRGSLFELDTPVDPSPYIASTA